MSPAVSYEVSSSEPENLGKTVVCWLSLIVNDPLKASHQVVSS